MQQNVVRAAHSANYGFVMQTLNGAVNADQPKTADHRIERSVPRCPYDAAGRDAVAGRPYQKVVSAASQVGIATTSSQRRQTKIQVPDDATAFA